MIDSPGYRGARRGLFVVVLALAVLPLSGCRREPAGEKPPGIDVKVQVEPAPPRVGPVTVIVTLAEAGGGPLRGAEVKVEGGMNHAGMKPEFGDAREVEPGRYEAPLQLTMGGDWFLLVDARLADGRTVHEQVDVPGVKSQ